VLATGVAMNAAPAPAASSAKASDAPVAPDRVSHSAFELSIRGSGEYRSGQAGEVSIVLSAKPPFKMNAEYPYKFKLESTEGLEYPALVVGKEAMKLEKTMGTMTIKVTPQKAGRRQVIGKFLFSVCTDEKCLNERRDLALTLEVR
jgi:hypothetical protein